MSNDDAHQRSEGQPDEEGFLPESDQGAVPRRRILQAGAAGAAAAAIAASGIASGPAFGLGGGETARDDAFNAGAAADAVRRPNFLFVMVDQERFAPPYESDRLKAWRDQYLRSQNMLAANGVTMMNHSIMSTACVPSRTSLFTGQYPSLHGCTQTDGGAKEAVEWDMFWLHENTVPTMGNYFREAGYRTYYKGKWHVAESSIFVPGSHVLLMNTFDDRGNRDRRKEDIYLKANLLDPFGFDGWIGPEPHPTAPFNVGRLSASSAASGTSGRDAAISEMVVEQLEALNQDRNNQPWLLVASMIDPHDIALFGVQAALAAFLYQQGLGQRCQPISGPAFVNAETTPPADQLFDTTLWPQVRDDNLRGKPSCHASNRDAYRNYMQGIKRLDVYSRYYYTLQQRVDDQIFKILEALKRTRFYQDTIVVYTSDHGEYLGAHQLHQKWYSAYEEVTHVPCIISNPRLFPTPRTVEAVTNHADLIPTMLGLAGIDPEPIRQRLAPAFTDAQPLVGRNLTDLLTGRVSSDQVLDPVFYMTSDDMSNGQNQFNWIGYPYKSVVMPNNIETVVVWFEGELWKYSRYFDTPQFWTNNERVGCAVDNFVKDVTANKPEGIYVVPTVQVVKRRPRPVEWEMYNVTQDPGELRNLAGNLRFLRQERALREILQAQACEKRLQPTYGSELGAEVPVC